MQYGIATGTDTYRSAMHRGPISVASQPCCNLRLDFIVRRNGWQFQVTSPVALKRCAFSSALLELQPAYLANLRPVIDSPRVVRAPQGLSPCPPESAICDLCIVITTSLRKIQHLWRTISLKRMHFSSEQSVYHRIVNNLKWNLL